jgi:energy-coupling factor transporter ATP-binding protein EcfA2
MTQVIEIVVIGATGAGKSHVLEVIDRALHSEYGQHVQVASHELSIERFMGSPSSKPSVSDTIFSLREQSSAPTRKVDDLKVSIDTSEVTSALNKIEAIQGEAIAFTLDSLESAIRSTTDLLNDHAVFLAESNLSNVQRDGMRFVGEKLNSHLNRLLAAQLDRFASAST